MQRGVSLESKIQQKIKGKVTVQPFSLDEVLELAVSLLRIASFLENNKLTHYDLKPSKIIFFGDLKTQKYKIYDLGVATREAQLASSNGKREALKSKEGLVNCQHPLLVKNSAAPNNTNSTTGTTQTGEESATITLDDTIWRINLYWGIASVLTATYFCNTDAIDALNAGKGQAFLSQKVEANAHAVHLSNLGEQREFCETLIYLFNEISTKNTLQQNYFGEQLLARFNALKLRIKSKYIDVQNAEDVADVDQNVSRFQLSTQLTATLLNGISERAWEFHGK